MEGFIVLEKSGKVDFHLPKSWKILKNALLKPVNAQESIYEMVDESL
jgi:hypothetical protein